MHISSYIPRPPRGGPPSLALALILIATNLPVLPASARADDPAAGDPTLAPPESAPWSIDARAIGRGRAQGQLWQVDYRLRNDGPLPVAVPPGALSAEVDGWVSNSRAAGHATPRRSRLGAHPSGPWMAADVAQVVDAREETHRCRERATLEARPEVPGADAAPDPMLRLLAAPAGPAAVAPIIVPPGGVLDVRLRLEHLHFLYGPYEPLLGARSLTLRIGTATIRDELPLSCEQDPTAPAPAWAAFEPPPDRRDAEVYATAPDSVHLAGHIPGGSTFRLTGPVRYGTRMKLSFWYLVAPGGEGENRLRLTQHKAGPSVFRTLHDGELEMCLDRVGRWAHVERVIRTEPEATQLTVEFKLTGDVAEMWVDDVTLVPVDLHDLAARP